MDGNRTDTRWKDAMALTDFTETNRRLVKIDGHQIALFRVNDEILACDNRCPHEGYPLIEGVMSDSCVLTCNWHNWKFDLKSGETLVGGDRLRRYPTDIRDGRIYVDLAPPSAEDVIEMARADLLDSFDDHDYSRMAREIARIMAVGGDPLIAVRSAVQACHDRFEFGMTHAIAAGADWLRIYNTTEDETTRLAVITEVVAHIAWDSRLQPRHPYTSDKKSFDMNGFVDVIDSENETEAIAYIRGALGDSLGFDDLYHALATAALAHYQDFGHSLIYVEKAREFVHRAGDACLEPVLLMLTRSLIYATREDLIPQFKAYAPALENWRDGEEIPDVPTLRYGSVDRVLTALQDAKSDPMALYDALLSAGAWQMLHMDVSYAQQQTGPVQDNVGWLDFTHTITFANAVRRACTMFPDLWPQGLLQIGCFLGRNAKYVNADQDVTEWAVDDPLAFAEAAVTGAIDHGQAEYIVAAHVMKLPTAVLEEIATRPKAPWAGVLAASLNRFLNSPLKRKHTLRTAHQALQMVAKS